MTASKFDLLSLDATKPIVLGYHGGCPDGCGAAYIMQRALLTIFPSAQIDVAAICHQGKKFSAVVRPDAIVFALDISPALDDLEALRGAARVIVLDHHDSEKDTSTQLQAALPNLVDLSDMSGSQCGTSLARALVADVCDFDEDVVHMLHKMDVFQYSLPVRLEGDLVSFKAFLTQHGERNVSLELVQQMFEDRPACLAMGRNLAAQLLKRTDKLAAAVEVAFETGEYRVLLVEQASQCRPIDFMRYQKCLDEWQNGKPTLVLTQDVTPLDGGKFNVGLRRAGPEVNVAKVASTMKSKAPFVSGGGHPFAGGCQSSIFVPRPQLLRAVCEVMDDFFARSDAKIIGKGKKLPATERDVSCSQSMSCAGA